jgi:Transposase DDE domain
VEARGRFAAAEERSARPAQRSGGHHPGHLRPVASLQKREGLLALRFLAPALLLPYPLFAEPTQPSHPSSCARALRLLQRAFSEVLTDPSAVYRVMDTTLIPAIVRVRASRKGLFCGQATFGRSASKTEWVYGFKAALVVDPSGVITAFGLAPASSEERPIGEVLIASDRYGSYLADKGFTGVEWERHWMQRYGALVVATPYEDSRRAWRRADRRWASGKRQIIEGVIGQLKDFFGLERHRAKTLGGLLARLGAKVAPYSCGEQINDSLGRPLRHLADLLV